MKTATVRSWQKGNVMADEWVSTGTDKASGKPWGVSGFEILTFNDDGLITRDDTYVDYVTILKQTGQYKGPTPGRPVASLPTGEPERHVSKGDAAEDANVQHLNDLNVSWARMDDKTALGLYADDAVTNDFTDDKPRDKKYAKEFWAAARQGDEGADLEGRDNLRLRGFHDQRRGIQLQAGRRLHARQGPPSEQEEDDRGPRGCRLPMEGRQDRQVAGRGATISRPPHSSASAPRQRKKAADTKKDAAKPCSGSGQWRGEGRLRQRRRPHPRGRRGKHASPRSPKRGMGGSAKISPPLPPWARRKSDRR